MRQSWRKRAATLKQDTYALYLAGRDSRVPWPAKVLLIMIVAYALSPIDLIPDFVPVLGFLDDLILLPLGIALAIKLTPPEIWEECKEQARSRLASDLPRSRTAAFVIVVIWLAAIGFAVLLVFQSLTPKPT